MARPDLFPPDRGLQVRMLVALLVHGALLAAAVAAVVWLIVGVESGWAYAFFLACFVLIGAQPGLRRVKQAGAVQQADVDRVEGSVRALCMTADLPVPEVAVVSEPAPLSWTVAPLRGRPTVSVTTALLDVLSQRELEAVLAHELSHLGNRDAVVMTALAGPPVWLLRGVWRMWEDRRREWRRGLAAILYGLPAVPIGSLLVVSSRIVSRHRELAADRGAAVLTGTPSALGSALRRLSGDLAAMPATDLRVVAARDPFHLLPARRREARGLRRLWATHPRLRRRLAQLERMETALQR